MESGSSRGRLPQGTGALNAVPWGRAGQRLTSQDPVPPYLRETQGRPGNGSGDQSRVPVAGASISAEVGMRPSQAGSGPVVVNSVSRSPAMASNGHSDQAEPSVRVQVQSSRCMSRHGHG